MLCKRCRESIDDSWEFCIFCGSSVKQNSYQSPRPGAPKNLGSESTAAGSFEPAFQLKRSIPQWFWPVAVACVISLALLIDYALTGFDSPSSSSSQSSQSASPIQSERTVYDQTSQGPYDFRTPTWTILRGRLDYTFECGNPILVGAPYTFRIDESDDYSSTTVVQTSENTASGSIEFNVTNTFLWITNVCGKWHVRVVELSS